MTSQGFKIFEKDQLYSLPQTRESEIRKGVSLFSGRNYIWFKTWPLLKNKFWLGDGPGHFPLEYPQVDPIKILKKRHRSIHKLAKPHNMYFQIVHASGWLSLLALLSLWGYILIISMRGLTKERKPNPRHWVQLGLWAGIANYLLAGVINDNIVGVTNVFWVFLGLIYALNQLNLDPQRNRQ